MCPLSRPVLDLSVKMNGKDWRMLMPWYNEFLVSTFLRGPTTFFAKESKGLLLMKQNIVSITLVTTCIIVFFAQVAIVDGGDALSFSFSSSTDTFRL